MPRKNLVEKLKYDDSVAMKARFLRGYADKVAGELERCVNATMRWGDGLSRLKSCKLWLDKKKNEFIVLGEYGGFAIGARYSVKEKERLSEKDLRSILNTLGVFFPRAKVLY